MEFEDIVRFSSYPRPFRVEHAYCDNPDCDCYSVRLFFKEVSDYDEETLDPMSFRVSVDLETWMEMDPPPRPKVIADCVQEFLAECPPEKKSEYQAEYKETKQDAKRLIEYTIDPVDVVEGRLISYADIIAEKGALSAGGNGYTHSFPHEGREYLVEDLYCPNPDCHCDKVHVSFWERDSKQSREDQPAIIHHRFQGTVTLEGCIEITERDECDPDTAEEVFSAWWDSHGDDLNMFKDRYEQVKEVGQRNLDAGFRPPARRGRLLDTPSPFEDSSNDNVLRDEPKPSVARTGRNDPCPCGSGKKYKKCCMRKEQIGE